ncbi:hypothetical protein Dda_2426 [Drechslerella dactyloides]|uniref:Rhodopsin domain-containing protein n=1 Tax=Drechslerella dactyloides TaxID=74499 RepID=A0AAD6J5E2_DREDA|nr:hypothetical protein Dda_2426 [Drechslerella dactyloides]
MNGTGLTSDQLDMVAAVCINLSFLARKFKDSKTLDVVHAFARFYQRYPNATNQQIVDFSGARLSDLNILQSFLGGPDEIRDSVNWVSSSDVSPYLPRAPGAGHILIPIFWVFTILTTTVLALRLWSRQSIAGGIRAYDWIMVVGYMYMALDVIYPFTALVIKCSLLLFYYNLSSSPARYLKIAVWVTFAFATGTAIASAGYSLFKCTPVSFWTEWFTSVCDSNQTIPYLVTGAAMILADLIIWLMPLPLVMGLKLYKRERIAAIFTFSLGIFACIASCFRLWAVHKYFLTTGGSGKTPIINAWAVVELNLAIICASAPALRALWPIVSSTAPIASGVSINNGKAYLTFETVPGFFLQDDPSTDPSTFDYVAANFGLIDRPYLTDDGNSLKLTQWQKFNRYVDKLNYKSGRNVEYRLLFIGRHSEGYHNAEESYVGTPSWNCYWAELYGNETAVWEDASLTAYGKSQAVRAHNFWKHQIDIQKITPPDAYYVSPLARCLETANITYSGLKLKARHPFIPTVKELLREAITIHTCDRRSSKSWITANYPTFRIEPSFSEEDQIWSGILSETASAQAYRMKVVLSDIFSSDHSTIISITAHSGAIRSMLSVLGHIPFSLVTGAIIPTLIKITTVRESPSPTTTQPWTAEAWCTNGPPVASGSGGCTCNGGMPPVTASPIISPR